MAEIIENIQIVVDDRERSSGLVPELEKLGGVVVKIEHLALGDYCIDGAVLIERKTAADFAQSLIDGRLFRQAGRLAASSMRPAYLLEGSSAEWVSARCGRVLALRPKRSWKSRALDRRPLHRLNV